MKTLKVIIVIVNIVSIIFGITTILLAAMFLLDRIDNLGYVMMGMLSCLISSSVSCSLLAIIRRISRE